MIAFEVLLNGSAVCTSGVEKGTAMVLINRTANTAWQREKDLPPQTSVSVSGLESDTGEHVEWADCALMPGDELTIRVVQDPDISPVRARRRPDPLQERAQQERYVENLATQLGWTLIKPPSQ
jgi:hypothetical protein